MAHHLTRLGSLGATRTISIRCAIIAGASCSRILLRDVLELAPLPVLLAEQNDLAEACLLSSTGCSMPNDSLTIIALGKFGGREIGYGADLDVIFIGDDPRGAQQLSASCARPDDRGRKSRDDRSAAAAGGRKRPARLLARNSARLLREAGAVLGIAGADPRARDRRPARVRFRCSGEGTLARRRRRGDLVRQIEDMLVRIANARGSGNDFYDFKTGIGGMIEAEFLVQGLQMRHAIWEPNFLLATEKLAEKKVLERDRRGRSAQRLQFSARCESVLRRWQNRSVSTLPATRAEEEHFRAADEVRALSTISVCLIGERGK